MEARRETLLGLRSSPSPPAIDMPSRSAADVILIPEAAEPALERLPVLEAALLLLPVEEEEEGLTGDKLLLSLLFPSSF